MLAMILVAGFATGGHMVVQHAISLQEEDAEIINISGRQRMLSQRIALLLLELTQEPENNQYRSELLKATDLMRRMHHFLSNHANQQQQTYADRQPTTIILKPSEIQTEIAPERMQVAAQNRLSDQIKTLFFEKLTPFDDGNFYTLNQLIEIYISKAEDLAKLSPAAFSANKQKALDVVHDYPEVLLQLLDEVVRQYELESYTKVEKHRFLDNILYATILILLISIGLLIFRPMEKRVYRYWHELQEAQKELAKKQQQERLAALGKLSGGIAHEINNVLLPIVGLTDIIKKRLEENKDETSLEHIKIIQDSVEHAKNIVTNILAFARDQEQNFRTIPAHDVLKYAIDFSKNILPSRIKIEVQGLESLAGLENLTIHCDKMNIAQVIMNLLKNAAEAMDNDGQIVFAIDRVFPEEAFLLQNQLKGTEFFEIRIQDYGHGMDEETLDRIFDPFFTTKGEGQGTGLGLSLSYGIIKDHGGLITASSDGKTGSTFSIYLPVADPEIRHSLNKISHRDEA